MFPTAPASPPNPWATLLTQFETAEFKRETIPFIDTPDKAGEVSRRIAERAQSDHHRPLVFLSIIDPGVRKAIEVDDCALVIDLFDCSSARWNKNSASTHHGQQANPTASPTRNLSSSDRRGEFFAQS